MKKIKGFMVMVIFTVIITSIVGCSKVSEENKIENKVSTEEKKEVNYKAVYKEEINKLINEYGKFNNPGEGLPIKGVKYAELVNFDKDEIPEMIVMHDLQVLLYKIDNGKAKCLYEGKVGSRYGQTDVAYRVDLNTNAEKTSLIVYHSEKVWEEERITIVTVDNNEAVSKELYAKAKDDNDIPIRENFVSYSIDNKTATADEYNKIYNSIVKNAKKIDACWDEEPASKSNLEAFLSSLE